MLNNPSTEDKLPQSSHDNSAWNYLPWEISLMCLPVSARVKFTGDMYILKMLSSQFNSSKDANISVPKKDNDTLGKRSNDQLLLMISGNHLWRDFKWHRIHSHTCDWQNPIPVDPLVFLPICWDVMTIFKIICATHIRKLDRDRFKETTKIRR